MQKEISEIEGMLTASKSREEIANTEINRLNTENTGLIEQIKRLHRKYENKKMLTKQLEITINQQKEASETISAQRSQVSNQNSDLIEKLKEKL